ncbi:zinc finger protein [Gracilaria domingensis]|nr:zinc finger protein [Gracilaria domingensis]
MSSFQQGSSGGSRDDENNRKRSLSKMRIDYLLGPEKKSRNRSERRSPQQEFDPRQSGSKVACGEHEFGERSRSGSAPTKDLLHPLSASDIQKRSSPGPSRQSGHHRSGDGAREQPGSSAAAPIPRDLEAAESLVSLWCPGVRGPVAGPSSPGLREQVAAPSSSGPRASVAGRGSSALRAPVGGPSASGLRAHVSGPSSFGYRASGPSSSCRKAPVGAPSSSGLRAPVAGPSSTGLRVPVEAPSTSGLRASVPVPSSSGVRTADPTPSGARGGQASRSDGKTSCPVCKRLVYDVAQHRAACTAYYCRVPGCNFAHCKMSQLKRHEKIHAPKESREFACPRCGRRFVQNAHLQNHFKSCFREELEKEEEARKQEEERRREEARRLEAERMKEAEKEFVFVRKPKQN